MVNRILLFGINSLKFVLKMRFRKFGYLALNIFPYAVTWRNVQDTLCNLLQSIINFPILGSSTA